MESILLITTLLIDTIMGDPRSNWHPVVIIGRLISQLESHLLNSNDKPLKKRITGLLVVITILAITYFVTGAIIRVLDGVHPVAALAGAAFIFSFTISPRSLAEAGREIKEHLVTNNLEQARYKVGWIVGRDTKTLDTAEVTRATVETIAENIVDGIIAPLFYFAIGGVPLAFLYRSVNTLDSMIGYKNEKYKDFGMIAARLDDIFNYIPARITAFLIICTALLWRYNVKGAITTIWRDAAKHPSPNSGYAEAGVAGALNIRLGGLNYYGGTPSFRAYMGEPLTELVPVHIEQTIKIMYTVTLLFVIIELLIINILL